MLTNEIIRLQAEAQQDYVIEHVIKECTAIRS